MDNTSLFRDLSLPTVGHGSAYALGLIILILLTRRPRLKRVLEGPMNKAACPWMMRG